MAGFRKIRMLNLSWMGDGPQNLAAPLSAHGTSVTVFTATFNRGALLKRLYASLEDQDYNAMEWLIVDDGSTDGTEAVVRAMQSKASFPIRYYWQDNRGKHVAINRGVALANGTLFVIVDSDDQLIPGALQRIRHWWETIPWAERPEFAGVVGLYRDGRGLVVGTGLPQEVLDTTTVELRTRYRVRGDMLHVYRADVLRQYPFPEDLGTFVPEALVWNRIALRYKMRCVNEIWGQVEYLPDGLSARSVELRARSPAAARLYYKEFTEIPDMGISTLRRIREYANYTRFSLHASIPVADQLRQVRSKVLWLLGAPIGVGAFVRDKMLLARGACDQK